MRIYIVGQEGDPPENGLQFSGYQPREIKSALEDDLGSCSVLVGRWTRRGERVPAWSPEIANELIRLASAHGRAFDQMQLQELVYIAHGWCLAITGEPLTGDRPEALEHGPEYRRLAQALARWGIDPVTSEIALANETVTRSKTDATLPGGIELFATERDILAKVYADYGSLRTSQLATLTRVEGTPWAQVFASGAGKWRDIPHDLIRAQFARIAAKSGL